MDQVSIKYTNILHCKALQNLDFWFENKPSGNPGQNYPLMFDSEPKRQKKSIYRLTFLAKKTFFFSLSTLPKCHKTLLQVWNGIKKPVVTYDAARY
jgi:hypothetical protein